MSKFEIGELVFVKSINKNGYIINPFISVIDFRDYYYISLQDCSVLGFSASDIINLVDYRNDKFNKLLYE